MCIASLTYFVTLVISARGPDPIACSRAVVTSAQASSNSTNSASSFSMESWLQVRLE